MNIIDKITSDLDITIDTFKQILSIAHNNVKLFSVPKRSGGYRLISSPDIRTKLIQYWLMQNIFCKFPIHHCAFAYRESISIKDNAEKHRYNKYFIAIDFKDFFSSIKFADYVHQIKKLSKFTNNDFLVDSSLLEVIKEICFSKTDTLPIGYPSSPMISNIVMYDFDKKICDLLDADYHNSVYTRYADDIIISTNERNISKLIYKDVKKVILNNKYPKLLINFKKVKFLSSAGGSAFVTGVKINPMGSLSLGQKQKDHVRLLLTLLQKGKLQIDDINSLKGHLSYIRYIDPKFYTKLQSKYFKIISEI